MKRMQKRKHLVLCVLLVMGMCACTTQPQQPAGGNQEPVETTDQSTLWTASQYYDYLRGVRGMVALIDSAPQNEADQLAAFAYLMLDEPNFDQGEDPAALNAILQRYFGVDLSSWNTSYTRLDENTGRVFPTGWSFDSSAYFVLREQHKNETEITATFDVYNVADSVMIDFNPPRSAQQIKDDLLSGNTTDYGASTSLTLTFTTQVDETGMEYLQFVRK